MPIDRRDRFARLDETVKALARHSEELHNLAIQVRMESQLAVEETRASKETRRRPSG
jgi:hypothetical protein